MLVVSRFAVTQKEVWSFRKNPLNNRRIILVFVYFSYWRNSIFYFDWFQTQSGLARLTLSTSGRRTRTIATIHWHLQLTPWASVAICARQPHPKKFSLDSRPQWKVPILSTALFNFLVIWIRRLISCCLFWLDCTTIWVCFFFYESAHLLPKQLDHFRIHQLRPFHDFLPI